MIFKDMRIKEQILAAKAKLKEKHQVLAILVPPSGRSRSDTPARHHRYQAEESSPESIKNVSENVSQGKIETLKTEILELKDKINEDLNNDVFQTFEQTLVASLQAPFRDIVEAKCDSNDYVDVQSKLIQGRPSTASCRRSSRSPWRGRACTPARRTRTR